MSVCRQIRLVLWKNFTIRRRRWPRVLFELIWPLFLFLILMWVRTRNLVFHHDACHQDPKNLGSTGFFPALQTYLCRWNSTCFNYSTPDVQFNTQLWDQLADLSSNLSIIFNDNPIVDYLTDLLNEIKTINISLNIWNGTISANKSANDFSQTIPSTIIDNLFSSPVNLSNLHQSWLINRTNTLSNLDVIFEIYFVSIQSNYSYRYQSETDIKQSFCVNGEFDRTFSINASIETDTKDFLCSNLSANDLKEFLISVQRQLDNALIEFMDSNFISLAFQSMDIMSTIENLQARFESLNVSLPFQGLNAANLSLRNLCGGRNDLSANLETNPSNNDGRSRYAKQPRILNEERATDGQDPYLFGVNWTQLASDLFLSNESSMCTQTYEIGSNNVKKIVTVQRGCRCVLFDKEFNSNKYLKDFGRILRPLLYGKIYYYPSNKYYDQIIRQINQTFESLDEFIRLCRQIQSIIRPNYQLLVSLCNLARNSPSACQQIKSYENFLTLFTLVTEFAACSDRDRFVAKSSESAMVSDGQTNSQTNTFLAGIKFVDEISDNDAFPKHIKYKIRMALDYVDNTFRTEDRYFQYSPRYGTPSSTKYHTFMFIYLQNALDRAIINLQTGANVSYGIQTQQMPYPCWSLDQFVNSIRQMLPLFMVLSWIFTVSMNVKDIVYEKEKRLKEIMRIMGLKDSVHWLTWFVLCTTVMIITAILLVLILKFGRITQYSNFLVLLVFFIAYTFATINQCFLLSVFFNRANLAACGAGIIYFVLYLPYTLLINYDSQTLTWHKVITCLSSTVAFGLGCDYIARFEGMEQGIQWSNINRAAKPNDNFTFLYCIIMMLADAVIYMLLTLYIENVFPGEYGIPQPWYYPLTKTYWFGYDKKKIRERTIEIDQTESEENLDPSQVGVHIKNLSKYYRNKIALKNLSVKFYRNMITAFLGRNGAGKSTTWSILTGLIPPSSGTVYIDGYDILTDIKMVRKRLGFAPQHNILFDRLTVREHLEFFSALKDAPEESIAEETDKMLEDLTLVNKSKNYSTQLSGGMKRKLSIAIAFIGNSTTVILDEPTAGVDPFARRAIWDLILKYKQGRTIVLSTHHLDEADLLCDRLAIISSGELQCVGTTMFLKRKYGEGYNLIIESTINHHHQSENNSNEIDLNSIELTTEDSRKPFQDLTEFLRTYMPDIKIKEEHGDQITYIVLDDVEHTKIFPRMLMDLDANKDKFAIKNYGLSNSSIEQVFLRVADEVKRVEDYERTSCWQRFIQRIRCCKKTEDKPEEQQVEENSSQDEQLNQCLSADWSSKTDERYTGIAHFGVQVLGLLIKRFHRTKRNIKGLIAEILLPIIFVLLAMLVTKLTPSQTDPPPLILHPWYWEQPNYMFQSLSTSQSSNFSKSIQQTFTKSPSFGTRCMKTSLLDRDRYSCDSANTNFVSETTDDDILNALNQVNYSQTKVSPQCDCYKKRQVCPIGAGGPSASYDVTETKDILYRLDGFNITDWITKTEYWEKYLMKRFGGFEFFHNLNSLTKSNPFNESVISQINRFINLTNQSSISNAQKIASLFEINPPQISVWYNNKGWPASVAFINIFNNAFLRAILFNQNSSSPLDEYGITAINHPLPQTEIQLDSELQNRIGIEMFTAICVIFALAFIPASFLVFLIDERVTTSKHLQFVSGVRGITYWWANFLWDLGNYCVSITCCIIIFLAFGIEAYIQGMNFLCLILLLFLYGFAIIPLMYPINYLFKTPSTGFVLVSCINIFVGIMTTVSTITLESFDTEDDLKRINNILTKVFLIFPHYCLGRGLFDMSKTHATNILSLKYISGYVAKSPFEFNIVGRNLFSLTLQGVFFFLFAILVQYRFFIPDRGCVKIPDDLKHSVDDNDVAAERQRIYSDPTNQSGDILRMLDLIKIYGWRFGKKFIAVKRTCVGIKTGECFGLLGINGSGKSTTFKMLTGEIPVTDGNALINNYSVINQLSSVHKNIGYCPQFDALDSLLTAREHLYLYARLRGIRRKNIPYITDCLLQRLGLTLWADRPVKQYSGGNKRKLSTAISLIGNPSIIFMDEPTTGMDVRAKRFLWNCILTLTRNDHKSVVITSHSMEECETLCNRLVIMVSGEFKCLGSVQHLKTKFGDGYTILVRINIDADSKPVIDYIKSRIPETNIKEEHNKMIHFRVSTNVPLYEMFRTLEDARDELVNVIEDYTVTQVTLDDVFVNFAKMQEQEQIDKNKIHWFKRSFLYKLCARKKQNTIEMTKL